MVFPMIERALGADVVVRVAANRPSSGRVQTAAGTAVLPSFQRDALPTRGQPRVFSFDRLQDALEIERRQDPDGTPRPRVDDERG